MLAGELTLSELSPNERKYAAKNPLLKLALLRFVQAIFRTMPNTDQILDAGCGEGYIAKQLLQARPNIRIYGIDHSMRALQQAARICPSIVGSQADAIFPPFRKRAFDLVLSLEVLEHLHQPEAAIAGFKELTSRYILLSVPNEPIYRLQRALRGQDVLKIGTHPEHVNNWSLRGFRNFLLSQDLSVLRSFSPFPFSWSIVLCETRG